MNLLFASREARRRERGRSKPELEALEGRELLSHAHIRAAVRNPGAGPLPGALVSNVTPSVAPSSLQDTIGSTDVQPFLNTVLKNGFARQLSLSGHLSVLLDSIGQQAGQPGYIPFLDTNRDGVIERSEVVPLFETYLPPFHLLRVT